MNLRWWECSLRQLFNRVMCRLSGRYHHWLMGRICGGIDEEVEHRAAVRRLRRIVESN